MAALIAAYLIVWMAVVFYLSRLGAEQRRLARRLEDLRLYGNDIGDSEAPQERPRPCLHDSCS